MFNIIEKLVKAPENFGFFQAVRLLEEHLKFENFNMNDSNAFFEKGVLSENNKFIRFKHNASLIFPASEIEKFSVLEKHYEMNINIMGLIGPTGVLHNHHTAMIIERLQHKDFALRDFLDMFQHRAASFFYFSWKKNHLYAERKSKNVLLEHKNIFSRVLLSLIGQGTPSLQNRENIPDEIMLYYAPYFSRHHRSALGLESILSDYFNNAVRVKIFQKKWMRISDADRSRLSCRLIDKNQWEKTEKIFNQLAVDAICGQRQLQYQYHFCLIIGPLDIEKFISFLPDQKSYSLLIALTRRYSGIENTFDIRLVLKAKSIPSCQLGRLSTARLGWCSWLKVREFVSDATDTILYIRSLS